MKNNKLAPIALFVYNRPDHTQQSLNAIKNADLSELSELFIFSDGGKSNNDEKVEEVRRIIKNYDSCKKVTIIESDVNKGLAKSIKQGINLIFEKYEKIIVLEDDLIISKGFLKYCNEALNIYENYEQVMQIAGSSYQHVSEHDFKEDTYFLKCLQCHGWATWKRSWENFNDDALDHLTYFNSNKKKSYEFDLNGNAYFLKQLKKNVTREINTWAVKWYASILRMNGLILFPKNSLVQNIGFDSSGVHCNSNETYLSKQIDYVNVLPIELKEDNLLRKKISLFWKNYLKKVPEKKPLKSIKNKILKASRFIFKKIVLAGMPELLDFTKNEIDWSSIKKSILGSNFIDNTVIIKAPCKIANVIIEKNSYVTRNAIISYTEIGKFVSIGPNFLCGWGVHPTNGISTNPSFYSSNPTSNLKLSESSKIEERKKISIGNDVFIGGNVTVLDGVNIGDGAIIGAGTVVSKNVPPYAIAIGNPMKILKYRYDEKTIEQMLKIKWWNWRDEELQHVEKNFFNIEKFIASNEDS